MDVFSRMIVGWQLADHLRTDLVLDALGMSVWRRDLTAGDLIHPSDTAVYTSVRYTKRLTDAGIASIGRNGGRRVRQRDGRGPQRDLQARAGEAHPVADPDRPRVGHRLRHRRGVPQLCL